MDKKSALTVAITAITAIGLIFLACRIIKTALAPSPSENKKTIDSLFKDSSFSFDKLPEYKIDKSNIPYSPEKSSI